MERGVFVRSKIVCTIGPVSKQPEMLEAMTEAGMDVARINLSHGDFNTHRQVFEALADIEEVSTIIDLPGPKIRLGDLDGSVVLKPKQKVHLTTKNIVGNSKELPITYPNLPREINVGNSVFINDGLIEIKITSIDCDLGGFDGIIIAGGEISSHKGVNVPGAVISIKPPTKKDLEGIKFGVEICDWFAISFVRDRLDVENYKIAIERAGGDQPLISKIEHRDALERLDEIIDASDGIMVARGDLGIEIPSWEVPLIQKKIINKCNKAGKPVIVATQMLESMTMKPRPTRAEASDVANAILDGADAIMLSEETAVGLFPLEAVKVMNSISLAVEQKTPPSLTAYKEIREPIADIIGNLASRAADILNPKAIIVVTRSGFSARMISKHRPRTQIISVAKNSKINRRTRLYWGVEPLNVVWTDDRDKLLIRALKRGIVKGLIDINDVVMIVSGSTLEAPGRTSSLEILNVQDILYHASQRG